MGENAITGQDKLILVFIRKEKLKMNFIKE
jgi:hypothetical protein